MCIDITLESMAFGFLVSVGFGNPKVDEEIQETQNSQ